MGASGACLDVEMCSAWPLVPGKEGSGGVPLFWQRTLKRLLLANYPSDLNQIWHEASGQCGLTRLCSTIGSAPSEGSGGQLNLKSGISANPSWGPPP